MNLSRQGNQNVDHMLLSSLALWGKRKGMRQTNQSADTETGVSTAIDLHTAMQ